MVRRLKHFRQKLGTRLPLEFWVRCAEVFVGLFFIGAALYKIESYYIVGDQSLRVHFDYWTSMHLPPAWYQRLIHSLFSFPFGEKVLEFAVIALQGCAGAMVIAAVWKRAAGWMLLFVQINIFLGTLGNSGFNQFVGISIWVSLFLIARGEGYRWTARRWKALTLLMFLLQLLMLWNRIGAGDISLQSVEWQRENLLREGASSALWWKQLMLWSSQTPIGQYLWVGWWWALLVATLLLLTPLRLYGGAAILLLMVCETFTWTNSVTSHGVLSVLALYLWTTQEAAMIFQKKLPVRKSPRASARGR